MSGECKDTRLLPIGPTGEKGPIGASGPQGAQGPQGVQGLPGRNGRPVIDIKFNERGNPYKEVIYNYSDRHVMLGSFIYPGNDIFGGDPEYLDIMISHSGVTAATRTAGPKMVLVVLDSHTTGINADATIAESASIITNPWYFKLYTGSTFNYTIPNDIIRRFTNTALAGLPDTECLVGILITTPSVPAITYKIYSASIR